jgi:hypothetical protein
MLEIPEFFYGNPVQTVVKDTLADIYRKSCNKKSKRSVVVTVASGSSKKKMPTNMQKMSARCKQ